MRYLALLLFFPLSLTAQQRGAAVSNPQAGKAGSNAVPLPPPATAAQDLASVEGTVFNALTGAPLRKATITISWQNSEVAGGVRSNYSALTDAAGHFVINGIEPGRYRVNANHTGFLDMQYNTRRPGGPGTPLDLTRAQKLTA
jgi:hypothetical protein